MSDELSNHSNQAMLVCKRILDEYQEHGHDFEWQKTLLPRLCNLGEYIGYLIKEMDKEMTAHKQSREVVNREVKHRPWPP